MKTRLWLWNNWPWLAIGLGALLAVVAVLWGLPAFLAFFGLGGATAATAAEYYVRRQADVNEQLAKVREERHTKQRKEKARHRAKMKGIDALTDAKLEAIRKRAKTASPEDLARDLEDGPDV